jgi:hypothetical protein
MPPATCPTHPSKLVSPLYQYLAKIAYYKTFYAGTTSTLGRAIAQVVSRRLPTAAARVRAQIRSCGICGGQRGTGAALLRVLRFPLSILIPPTDPHSSSSGACTIGQLVADVPLHSVSFHPMNLKKQKTTSSLPSEESDRALELRSSLRARSRVSHQYTATGKPIALHNFNIYVLR